MNALARRRFQTGQLIDDRDRWIGRWREDVLDVRTGQMKRIRRQEILGSKKELPSKRLAQRALAERLKDINADDYKPLPHITFSAFAKKWTAEIAIHHKPSTQDNNKVLLKYLMPFFGELPLKQITLESLQRYVNQWDKGPKTLRNVIVMMMGMWDHATGWGYASHNPFVRGANGRLLLRMPRRGKPKSYAYSPEEVLAIIDKAQGQWKLFFRTAAELGCRPGEIAGLKRTDIKGRNITLSRSVYRQVEQTQKTENSNRSLWITQELADDLQRFMEETAGRKNPNGYVWVNNRGKALRMIDVSTKVLGPILEELGIRAKLESMGIEKCGMYAFRHYNITEMRRMGVPLKTIQERVGHAQGSDVTDRHYVHAVDSDNLAASELIGNLLSTKSEGRLQ